MITSAVVAAQAPLPAADARDPSSTQADSGFSVPAAVPGMSGAPSMVSTSSLGVEAGLILSLQEQAADLTGLAGQGGMQADRDARRRGRDLIGALAALQRALLAGQDEAACVVRLTGLLDDIPVAQDPVLGRLVASIRLRGEIEALRLMRHLGEPRP